MENILIINFYKFACIVSVNDSSAVIDTYMLLLHFIKVNYPRELLLFNKVCTVIMSLETILLIFVNNRIFV